MIKIRVDDFPHTKGEPQHTIEAFKDFNKVLCEFATSKYLLGAIPQRCSVDHILMLRNDVDCEIGMHGITHDERLLDINQNEFPLWLSAQQILTALHGNRINLENAVGRRVSVYMPPRNRIDMRTIMILPKAGFDAFTGGPETDDICKNAWRGHYFHSEFPHEYGRSDEMLQRNSHVYLNDFYNKDIVLTLHWTWEVNIGLNHLREFLSKIDKVKFADW